MISLWKNQSTVCMQQNIIILIRSFDTIYPSIRTVYIVGLVLLMSPVSRFPRETINCPSWTGNPARRGGP